MGVESITDGIRSGKPWSSNELVRDDTSGRISYKPPRPYFDMGGPEYGVISLGYNDLAVMIGLPSDTDAKSVKRACLDKMGLRRPEEVVLDVSNPESIENVVQNIRARGAEVIWVPVDGSSGGHRPAAFTDVNALPENGRVRIMERAISDSRRPFRLVVDGDSLDVRIDFGAPGAEAGNLLEQKMGREADKEEITTLQWDAGGPDSACTQLTTLMHGTDATQFVKQLFIAREQASSFSQDILALHMRRNWGRIPDSKQVSIGIEGYVGQDGVPVYVDVDIPPIDGQLWAEGQNLPK
jgi:hypothetical protein